MSNLNVLISGCGIGGSVFASWLLRAYPDANITIVERDSELRLTGASVDIRSSAVDIIRWMGAEQEIRNQSTHEEGMRLVEADGKEIATLNATGRSDMQSITSEYEIFRGELAKIFIDPIRARVNLIFGESVDHFEQHPAGVEVSFAKSKETRTYDLLVAADGLGSSIRGMMLGTKSQEQIYDEHVRIAYFTIKRDLLQGSRLATGVATTGGRAVYLRPDPHPAGRTRALLMTVTASGDVDRRKTLDTAIREGNESYMELMDKMYHDVGWLTPEVLRGMHESDDLYCSLIGQVRSPVVQDGRVVLLGDAAYATPGMGTSLAIMGGYVLAGELLNHSGDVKTASKRYEELMLPFVKSSQGSGGGMQLFHPQTAWGVAIKNTVVRLVTWMRLDKLAMMVASLVGFTEKKLSMPDYPWPAESI